MSGSSKGEFVKAGYLIKSPPDFKAKVAQWHRRWFLLMDSKLVYPLASRYVRLEYYQSEQEARRLADPKGVINLNTCTQVSNREPVKGHKFVFDVCTEERVYHLVAESGEDKQEWIDTLNTLLFSDTSPSQQRRWSPPHQESEVVTRERNSSRKTQRPLSFTGHPSPKSVHSRPIRPLPPVPDGDGPNKPLRQHRPLPPPPPDKPSTPTGDDQRKARPTTSPLIRKKREPPPKPAPYKKTSAPSTSATPTNTSSVDISEHYEVAPGQKSVMISPSVARRKVPAATTVLDNDAEYSVLESTNVPGFNPVDQDYSHLEIASTPPPGRHEQLSPEAPHGKGVHSVILSNDEDYSILHH